MRAVMTASAVRAGAAAETLTRLRREGARCGSVEAGSHPAPAPAPSAGVEATVTAVAATGIP